MKAKNSKKRRFRRSAYKAPNAIRDIVSSKWSKKQQKIFEARKLGTFGAASPCVIVMKDGVLIKPEGADE